MTARDEAIESMVDATDYDLRYRLGASGVFDLLGAMLDLIPADVLTRLAIERGGLRETEAFGDDVDYWDTAATRFLNDRPTLYRIATPEEGT